MLSRQRATPPDITWTSSNPEIASVDPVTGTITGRDAGGSLGSISTQKCTITATSAANGISREIQLTVTGKTGKYLSDVEITGKTILKQVRNRPYISGIPEACCRKQ